MAQVTGGWRPLQPPRRAVAADGVGLAASPAVRLARAHVLSVAGDTCTTIALAGTLFFDLSPDQAKGKVALSLVLTMAPFAIVAPLLGPLIDRRAKGRRATVLGAAAGRAALAVVAAELVESLALFPVVFAMLVLAKAHGVAKSSLVKGTVDDDAQLVQANGRLAVLASLAGLVAAIPAGIVLKLPFLGAPWTLRLAALSFMAAAIASVGVVDHRGRAAAAPAAAPAAPATASAAIRQLAPGVLPAAIAMAALRGIVGFLAFEVAFSFRRAGIPSAWLGVVLASSAAGTMLGSSLGPRLRRILREELMVLAAPVAVAAAGLLAWRVPKVWVACVLALVVGAAASSGRLAFDALVQRDNGEDRQAGAFARFEAGFQLVWVAGALVPTLVALPFATAGFALTGAAAAGGTAYATALWSLRLLRDLEEAAQ